jgi:ferredoxin
MNQNMATRVDPTFFQSLEKFGVKDWKDCYHCGNCTANCPLTEEDTLFPRLTIRQAQMGLKEQLISNTDLWMCYFCGDCTKTCPREANPCEIMRSIRRYQTSVYDWTGLSRKFYTSSAWEIAVILGIGIIILALFGLFLPPSAELWTNPARFINAQGGVMINNMVDGISGEKFLHIIHYGDWVMALIAGGLLISNIFRMFWLTLWRDRSVQIPVVAYFTEFWRLVFHFLTQPKLRKCDDKSYWLGHITLMTGYTIMFILIVALLPIFQTEEIVPWYNWQRILGYYATFGILVFLIPVIVGRFRKRKCKLKHSHPTDWHFIIMLGLTAISGIAVHIFRLSGMPLETYFSYVVHLAILVPMILIEVPFTKWSHLAYRPFAVYIKALKRAAGRRQAEPIPQFA